MIALAFALLLAADASAADPLAKVPASLRTGPEGKALTGDQTKKLAKGEILVALMETPGNPVKKGVAVAVVDAEPAKVFATCGDYEGFPEFMPYVVKTTVDSREGKTATVSYFLEFPLNIGNRNYQLNLVDGTRPVDGLDIYASDWTYTGKGNITDTSGSWEIAPWGDGTKSLVRYTVFTDPGGSFPNWVKNAAASTAIPKVIKSVRARVASPKAKAPVAQQASK